MRPLTIKQLCRARPAYKQKRVLAWHLLTKGQFDFHGSSIRPRLLNGEKAPRRVGRRTYQLQGAGIRCCCNGFHASKRIMDAARYVPGDWVCRVQVWGDLDRETRKLCGRYRKVLWIIKATDVFTQMAWDVGKRRLKDRNPTGRLGNIVKEVLAMEESGKHLKTKERLAMRFFVSSFIAALPRDTETKSILFMMLHESGMGCLKGTIEDSIRDWVNRELPKRLEKARRK